MASLAILPLVNLLFSKLATKIVTAVSSSRFGHPDRREGHHTVQTPQLQLPQPLTIHLPLWLTCLPCLQLHNNHHIYNIYNIYYNNHLKTTNNANFSDKICDYYWVYYATLAAIFISICYNRSQQWCQKLSISLYLKINMAPPDPNLPPSSTTPPSTAPSPPPQQTYRYSAPFPQ